MTAMMSYTSHLVGRRVFWRTASVVMACLDFNQLHSNHDADHWFEASWTQKWWGGKVLTLSENWKTPRPDPTKGGKNLTPVPSREPDPRRPDPTIARDRL
jgi:hypothetical protein